MNKFFAFAVFALVASASCQEIDFGWSEAAGTAGANTETDLLIGHERLFTDFCVNQAQRIKSDASEFSRQTGSQVTKIFFGNVNEITDDVVRVQKEAVAQLSEQLAKPSNAITDDAALSEDQIAQLIKEGKEAIQQKDGISGIIPATKATFQAMLSTVNSAVFTRLAKARAMVTGLNLYEQFKQACEKVAQYEDEMASALEETKKEILASTEDAEAQKFVQSVTVTSLNCFTTKTIVRLHGFCDIVQAGHKHFFKMLGMDSPIDKLEN